VYGYIFLVSFHNKIKGYDAVMKKVIKKHPLGIRDIFRNKSIEDVFLKLTDLQWVGDGIHAID